MTEDERTQLEKVAKKVNCIAEDLEEVREKVELVEEEQQLIKNIPGTVGEKIGELKGAVDTLTDLVGRRADQTDGKVDRATSFKNAMQFAGVILVPLLLALIGAYVAIHTGSSGPPHP